MYATLSEFELSKETINLLTEAYLLPDKFDKSRFSTPARKVLAQNIGISESALNSRIHKALKQKVLVKDEDGVIDIVREITIPVSRLFHNKMFRLEINFEESDNKGD
jgi:hypothetical protein